ncbi:MAG: response regulator [Beijerinckiaceae bacterium]
MTGTQPKFETARALSGARVLLVEDDYIVAIDLETTLVDAGAEVAGPCRTVKDALAAISLNELGAAVLDIRLGEETVGPVARQLDERGVPFFFYTGQIDTDPIRREWPHHKIISKPARPEYIVKAVADLLKCQPAASSTSLS